jgi:hypothetical protein
MDNKLLFKVFELKGMVGSFVSSASHHDSYNYPMIKEIEGVVNEMVAIVRKDEFAAEHKKVVFPQTHMITAANFHSKGVHSKRSGS